LKEIKALLAKMLAFLVVGIGMNVIKEEVVAYGLLLFLVIVILGSAVNKRLQGR
jgi:hypothetical protein